MKKKRWSLQKFYINKLQFTKFQIIIWNSTPHQPLVEEIYPKGLLKVKENIKKRIKEKERKGEKRRE